MQLDKHGRRGGWSKTLPAAEAGEEEEKDPELFEGTQGSYWWRTASLSWARELRTTLSESFLMWMWQWDRMRLTSWNWPEEGIIRRLSLWIFRYHWCEWLLWGHGKYPVQGKTILKNIPVSANHQMSFREEIETQATQKCQNDDYVNFNYET